MNRLSRSFAAALLVVISSATFAGITTTIKPGDWVLRKFAPGADPVNVGRYKTQDACVAATPEAGDFYRCDTSVQIKAVDNCIGVKAPTIPLVKNADGNFEEPDAFAVLVDGQWTTLQNLYVRGPPAAAECWVRGLADPDGWRVNGTNPSAPFMELVTPDMPPLADQPNWDSPDPNWGDHWEELWNNPVSVAARALP